jgi:signal transduction histidine kinase
MTVHVKEHPMSRLATFIRQNSERILAEWEAFARSLPRGDSMDVVALRDHARDMLRVISDDLDRPQTAQEQTDKGRGESDADASGVITAAQEHGAGRAVSGFTVGQMVAEFRSLRASVMRLWSDAGVQVGGEDLRDMTRFNEAIDQAIAESITQYSQDVGQSTERFLAILGHDLRNPVGAIVTSTSFMLENAAQSGDLAQPYLSLIGGVSRSARRINQMVADLLEFARMSFGQTIPVRRAPMDIEALMRDVVAEMRAASPERQVTTDFTGDLRGDWDRDRLFQAFTNLLGNAVQHGSAAEPIRVTAAAALDAVVISVHNAGPAIERDKLTRIFERMNTAEPPDSRDRRHLGLGLYIVDKIVTAHGGGITVQSSDEQGTTFTLRLPRTADAAAGK